MTASLYACSFDEFAYEVPEKGHGVFSYYLLEGMRGGAVDSNGEITVTGLAEYTQKKVNAWAQEQKGRTQTPWLEQSGGAKLVLAKVNKQVELVSQPSVSTSSGTIIWKDGAEMALIPAGSFEMGSNVGLRHERPVHRVELGAFYMDAF